MNTIYDRPNPAIRFLWLLPFMLLALMGPADGQQDMSAELSATLAREYHYQAPAPVEIPVPSGGVELEINPDDLEIVAVEPYTVVAYNSLGRDSALAAAQEAAARRDAKFSPITGGTIWETRLDSSRLAVGTWPKLTTYRAESADRFDRRYTVDLIKIDW